MKTPPEENRRSLETFTFKTFWWHVLMTISKKVVFLLEADRKTDLSEVRRRIDVFRRDVSSFVGPI